MPLPIFENISQRPTGIIVSNELDWKDSCLWFLKDYFVIQVHESMFNELFNQMTVPIVHNSKGPGGEILISHLL